MSARTPVIIAEWSSGLVSHQSASTSTTAEGGTAGAVTRLGSVFATAGAGAERSLGIGTISETGVVAGAGAERSLGIGTISETGVVAGTALPEDDAAGGSVDLLLIIDADAAALLSVDLLEDGSPPAGCDDGDGIMMAQQ